MSGHKIDMILDFQYGSTGKGLIAGYLAKREQYDTVVCAFAANAGHTYIDKERNLHVMTQQLPTGITSPTVKRVLIGPGALIHLPTLREEIRRYRDHLAGKQLLIHPHAAIIHEYHAAQELYDGYTKIGSTGKGVGAAAIERIKRNPEHANIAANFLKHNGLGDYLTTTADYRDAISHSENLLVEGAQGFGLSMYHGFYPYTTSRDVTPWQVAADCGLQFQSASYINIIGTLRTFPIRVNNRDGSSGPGYADQREVTWDELGLAPELTTVTKLPRRIFTFSHRQLQEAMFHCGHYWRTKLFLNFCNYMQPDEVIKLITEIEQPKPGCLNPPDVAWTGWGPDDADIQLAPQVVGL